MQRHDAAKDVDQTSGQGIDRRTMLGAAASAGGLAAMPVFFSGKAKAAAPKRGGTFRIGVSGGATTDSMDPGTFSTEFMQNMAGCCLNNLTEVDSNGQLAMELAESAEPSKDAKTWRFKLRKGVEFHNGKSLTADDVLASYRHHLGEDSKSAGKGILKPIEDISKDGNDTVVFVLKGGNADFPFTLSDYHIPIMPASPEGKLDWQSSAGTGAYRIDAFEPGVSAQLSRNSNYWKQGRGHFDAIDMLVITDSNARVTAIMSGAVDAIDKVPPNLTSRIDSSGSARLVEVTGTQHYTFPMRTNVKPFDNYDVRMALKLCVDRQQLLRLVLSGHGALGNDSPVAPSNRYFNASMQQRELDIDKAKHHLKKAGMDGLKVTLNTSDGAWAGAVNAAVLIKETAAEAGIDIEVARKPSDGYWTNIWNKEPWCVAYWGGRPTEDAIFTAGYSAESAWNDTAWQNERFNELLVQARAELDEAKRRDMYHEMQMIVSDDGGAIIPLFANHIMLVSNAVAHPVDVAGNWGLDGGKAGERWWFA